MEEEDFTSKEADNGQSATEAFNMMEMIKDESAQKNVKVYIITTILLGKRRVSNRGDRKHVHFSFYCQVKVFHSFFSVLTSSSSSLISKDMTHCMTSILKFSDTKVHISANIVYFSCFGVVCHIFDIQE